MTTHINKKVNPDGSPRGYIADTAYVADTAYIGPSTQVLDSAQVYGNAAMYGYASVYGSAVVYGYASVYGSAQVFDNARVGGNARVCGSAQVYGNAEVYDNARVGGNAAVYGNAQVRGNAVVYGYARVSQSQRPRFGSVTTDLTQDRTASIAAQTGAIIVPGRRIQLAKRVNATTATDVFSSAHDQSFKYKVGEWSEAADANPDSTVSCGRGLHASDPWYWHDGDTLIAVSFDLDDVLAVQEGKVRVRRLFVEGAIEGAR